ncbi:hypothetical protein IM538_13210 [Cytobacillus suaedae]|nr:hypothetical protein IM538_13210 [Cytobacillus suaedae]
MGCTLWGYHTLEEAVQSQWDSPIKVVNQDEENRVVYYLDQTQHVVGIYEYKNEKYFYNNEQSKGMRFTSEKGLPFYIAYDHFVGSGDIVYGAISSDNHVVDHFVIQYKNGETQKISAKNNTFITVLPEHVNKERFMSEVKEVYGYDKQGNVIETWYD